MTADMPPGVHTHRCAGNRGGDNWHRARDLLQALWLVSGYVNDLGL